MASVTLAESAKLAQNELVAGVIEDIITVNSMFEFLPFDSLNGNALQYTRENALGGVGSMTVGDAIGTDDSNALTGGSGQARDAATFNSVSVGLITLVGQADVNNLIQSTRSGDGNDQAATQIASKAKHLGRLFQHLLINGDDTNTDQFDGLLNLVPASQLLDTATDGSPLSLALLDELLDLVTDKDGAVDYLIMPKRTIRSYKALLRALGGTTPDDVSMVVVGTDGKERKILTYDGVPIFRNDYIPINQTQGATATATSVFAGTFDDGSRSHGIAGLTSEQNAGVEVVDVGESETKDEHIWRVRWYASLALFSQRGIARLKGITN